MTNLKYGWGVLEPPRDAVSLSEIITLPNVADAERLLQVVDYVVENHLIGWDTRGGRDPLVDLLVDLCMAAYYRDPVGRAALALGIVGGNTYPEEVEARLCGTFLDLFPTPHEHATREVARIIVHGPE